MKFRDKLILLVGAGSGIGAATAKRLAHEGATIAGVGRDIKRLENVIDSLEGEGHRAFAADVTEEGQLSEIMEFGKKNGGYNGGVFCAGLHEMRPIPLLKAEGLIASFTANVVSTMNCTKAIAKVVHPEGAAIVWLSSVAAIRGTAGFAAYSCAKGALLSAARVAAIELARKKIRVNVIVAGVVKTEMSAGWLNLLTEEQRAEIERSHLLGLGAPEDIASVAAFLLSDDARWITGTSMIVDGGLSVR